MTASANSRSPIPRSSARTGSQPPGMLTAVSEQHVPSTVSPFLGRERHPLGLTECHNCKAGPEVTSLFTFGARDESRVGDQRSWGTYAINAPLRRQGGQPCRVGCAPPFWDMCSTWLRGGGTHGFVAKLGSHCRCSLRLKRRVEKTQFIWY